MKIEYVNFLFHGIKIHKIALLRR